jgi:hypothetical protein
MAGRLWSLVGRKTTPLSILSDALDTKMTQVLADLFTSAKSPKIDWNGEPAYAIYEIIPAPNSVIVDFLKATSSPVQGLILKAQNALLEVAGSRMPEVVLWRDTAPDRIAVRVEPKLGKKASLKLWNVWRISTGGVQVMHAWLGNSGMRIDKSVDGKELYLRCSDGEGPVDFGDIEIRLSIE